MLFCRNVLRASGWVIVNCQVYFSAELLQPNGPAIKGGCVTRRQHRARSWYFSPPAGGSRCKEGMAHFLPSRYKFAGQYECRGTKFIGAANLSPVIKLMAGTGAIAVQVWSEPRIYHRLQIWWRALAQCSGTNCLRVRNLSRCRILIEGRCACPDATTITNLS